MAGVWDGMKLGWIPTDGRSSQSYPKFPMIKRCSTILPFILLQSAFYLSFQWRSKGLQKKRYKQKRRPKKTLILILDLVASPCLFCVWTYFKVVFVWFPLAIYLLTNFLVYWYICLLIDFYYFLFHLWLFCLVKFVPKELILISDFNW